MTSYCATSKEVIYGLGSEFDLSTIEPLITNYNSIHVLHPPASNENRDRNCHSPSYKNQLLAIDKEDDAYILIETKKEDGSKPYLSPCKISSLSKQNIVQVASNQTYKKGFF